jgi:hypothetical protein
MGDRQKPTPFSAEDMARRRKRNIALGLCLAGLMILFYVTTIVRMGGHIMDRAL